MFVRLLCKRPGLIGALIAVVMIILLLASPPNKPMSSENDPDESLSDLKARLQHLDSLYRAQREELYVLSDFVEQFLPDNASLPKVSPNSNLTGLFSSFTPRETIHLLRVPSLYHFLPHLLKSPSSLRPEYVLSKGRTGVSIILGVPTVKRDDQFYLMGTLRNLVESMSKEEMTDCLIIVLVAETNENYVLRTASQIEAQFSEHVESGLIDVIAPHSSYYPDFTSLKQTLGDSPERVQWRSKQNLDMAFLMMYAQSRGDFYVQLEDDILTKKNCVSTMRTFALEQMAKKEPWFVLVFCQLGFIGKLFKCVELPLLIQFLIMFYKDKPVDWLIEDLLATKVCKLDMNPKQCKKAKSELKISYSPSLFQHIGRHSSLKGKVSKLKDKQFGEVLLFYPHSNPAAIAQSAIEPFKRHTLQRAYNGDSFFWGLFPEAGDILTFRFHFPVRLKRFIFRSGNAERPSDVFVNTTVEAWPLRPTENAGGDGYLVVGRFDNAGLAQGDLNLGPIHSIRLYVHSDSDSWVILSEIHLIEEGK